MKIDFVSALRRVYTLADSFTLKIKLIRFVFSQADKFFSYNAHVLKGSFSRKLIWKIGKFSGAFPISNSDILKESKSGWALSISVLS